MAGEAASALGLSMAVLAERPDDAACEVAAEVVLGSPLVASELRDFAARCEVVTFDHEQVDLALVAALAEEGTIVRPGPATLEMAVDKAHMRGVLDRAGIPVPAYAVVDPASAELSAVVADFGAAHGWPLIVKAARGGYDGKGVWPVGDQAEAAGRPGRHRRACRARRAPPARCRDRRHGGPAPLGRCRGLAGGRDGAARTASAARCWSRAGSPPRCWPRPRCWAGGWPTSPVRSGVMAIELFWSGGRLLVNEVATRPHNSGHWTIEGSVTSQFENHLRAVLDLPLGSTALAYPEVASVNVFGGAGGEDPAALLPQGLAVAGAHVHLYGKGARPGRKLGHVTVCGGSDDDVRARAWSAALALGTPAPEGLALPALVSR